jgi:FkbM family methyltransferase
MTATTATTGPAEVWTPPESAEERLKRLLVPPGLYIRYLHRKARRKGEPELGLLPFLAPPGRLALDVGANKGVFTYALLRQGVPVHAFEPNPKLFRVLQGWADGRATLDRRALARTAGRDELRIPFAKGGWSNQGGSLSQSKPMRGGSRSVTIETAALDELALDEVGFIKIDVEGFECDVLAGAARTLARDRPNLLVEIEESHTGRALADVVDDVCGYGYTCLALVDGVLTPFSRLDPARHHRKGTKGQPYVFNFVFLPTDGPSPGTAPTA